MQIAVILQGQIGKVGIGNVQEKDPSSEGGIAVMHFSFCLVLSIQNYLSSCFIQRCVLPWNCGN